MAAVVNVISRHGLSIDTCHRNQHNKSKLALHRALIHINSHLKLLCICTCNKTEHFRYEGGYDVHGCICIEALKRKASLDYR